MSTRLLLRRILLWLYIQLDPVFIALGAIGDGGDPLAGYAVFCVIAEEVYVAVQVLLLLIHGA